MAIYSVDMLSQVLCDIGDIADDLDHPGRAPHQAREWRVEKDWTHTWTKWLFHFLHREDERLQDELDELSASIVVCAVGKGGPDGTACSSATSHLTCARVRPFS